MKKNKYKMLVLSDMKKSTSTVLKSAISLAKMINGDIQMFYVRKPTDIVAKENQLSAMRTINKEYHKTEKQIQDIIEPISNEYGLNIQSSFSFGNVKDEILLYIKEHKPDIIVLGKRKSKTLNIIGDRVTDVILKTFEGVIMIADSKNALEPNDALSLGVLNNVKNAFNVDFAENLIVNAQKPLKSFKIIKNSTDLKETKSSLSEIDTLEYVFESNDNALNNISKYLVKSRVNLLCLNRDKQQTRKTEPLNSSIKDLVNKLNVSVLLTGTQHQIIR